MLRISLYTVTLSFHALQGGRGKMSPSFRRLWLAQLTLNHFESHIEKKALFSLFIAPFELFLALFLCSGERKTSSLPDFLGAQPLHRDQHNKMPFSLPWRTGLIEKLISLTHIKALYMEYVDPKNCLWKCT